MSHKKDGVIMMSHKKDGVIMSRLRCGYASESKRVIAKNRYRGKTESKES